MTVDVYVGGWEHECCGPEIERYERVAWTFFIEADGRRCETHHAVEGLELTDVVGTVIDLAVIDADGQRVSVTRIPSGRALRGFDAADDGELREMYTERVLDVRSDSFIVTLDIR